MLRKKRNQKTTGGIFLLMFLMLITGCGSSDTEASGQRTSAALSVAVETQEIEYTTIEEYTKISCQVEAENEVTVTPQVSGIVEAVYVSVGDTVNAGDVLFEIDRTSLEREVAQANATYVQAQVNYDAALNGSLDNELASLQATVKDRQYTYNNAKQDYDNNKILFEAGAVSKTELDSLEANMESAKSELESAERELALYESSTMQGDLRTLEATLEQARANYDAAVDSLNDASVKAEISGVVSAVDVSVGNTVSTQTSAIRIVDMQRAKLSFGVTDKVINQIQVGSRAEITISSLSDEPFEGYVSAISPAADSQSLLYPVEIYIDNPDQSIKPGMFAMVRLATNRHEDVFALPVDAVIEESGTASVFVVGDDFIAHETSVETGLRNDQYIEITSGLDLGDIVVVVGQDFLEDGNQVNITAGVSPTSTEEAAPADESDSETSGTESIELQQ